MPRLDPVNQSADSIVEFSCRRCLARLRAPKAQAGTKRRCPRCQWVLEVPPETQPRASGEGYPIWEGETLPPPARQPHVAWGCPVCGTRLSAGEDPRVAKPAGGLFCRE